jgi:hypothetical protein
MLSTKMKKYQHVGIIFLFGMLLITACDIKNNDVLPDQTFTKIYDDDRFQEEYYPLDIIQTADKGYLVLSERKIEGSIFTGVYVLKTDENGAVVTSTVMDDDFVRPIKKILFSEGMYYFVCMSNINQTVQLIPVDEQGVIGTPVPVSGTTYPLVLAADGNNFLMQSYNSADKRTVVSVFNKDGQLSQLAEFDIGAGEDVEVHIIDHLTRNGTQLPFQVGKSGASYFFNGYFNYTFSLVFTDLSDDTPEGVCQGQQNLGGIGAVQPAGANSFAISRFNFGDNYLSPNANIPTNSITSSVDLPGNTFPELEEDAIVIIEPAPNTTDWLYASTTKSKRVVLFGFSQTDATLKGTFYLGASNPYRASSIAFTEDGGMVVLGQTNVEGRFPRIVIFKLDEAQLKQIIF